MSSSAEKYNRRGLRNNYVSTVIGISLVLFTIGLVLSGLFGLDRVQTQAKENLQGDLFFKADVLEADVKQIEQELKTWVEFKEVVFVSPEKALEEFSGNQIYSSEILEIFEGENPLPPTISFRPKKEYASKEGMAGIAQKLQKSYAEELDDVSYSEASVENVNLGFKQFMYLFLLLTGALLLVTFAMINNTIRLALYSKRFTIKTMQLVGAKPSFIRKPFIWQAAVQGFVSSIIGLALLMLLFYAINRAVDSIEISYTLQNLAMIFGIILVFGIVITVISTWLALNKYLRMHLDDLY